MLGVFVPSWDQYCVNVLSFCIMSRWGKKLSQPDYKYYERARA